MINYSIYFIGFIWFNKFMMYTFSTLQSSVYNREYFMLEDVCRLCWKRNATQGMLCETAKDETGAVTFLLDQIQDCLSIILTDECRPNKVCTGCIEEIKRFYQFKRFCQESDRKLREILENCIEETQSSTIKSEFNVKLENNISDLQKESFDDIFESIQTSDLEELDDKPLKVEIKHSYKLKRSLTYCNICRLDLETLENLNFHNINHGIHDSMFKCFGCEKRFKSRKTRLGHEKKFCKGLKDGYQCAICKRCLPVRRMYEAHMRDHRDKVPIDLPEELFKCKPCGLSFRTKQGLEDHRIEHGPPKKFVCESCGRVFTRQDYLHKHKLTHSGTRQHVCPHCGFRATQRSSLTVHIRKHTGERPYTCDLCPQRCISSSNLRAHRRRHLGVKQFECPICKKTFGYKVSLDEHVSSHHGSQSHACPHGDCGAIYSRKRGLRRHLTAKHEDKDVDKQDCNKIESLMKDFV